MAINLDNFFKSIGENSKMSDFQDLNHIDGVSVSTTCANLYSKKKEMMLFYSILEMELTLHLYIHSQN